jgi:hypothetical protein
MSLRRVSLLLLILAAGATMAVLTHGQESPPRQPFNPPEKQTLPVRPTPPTPPPMTPIAPMPATPLPPIQPMGVSPMPVPVAKAGPDLGRLKPLHQQMVLSTQRGAEWLASMNGYDGKFVPGWAPALNTPLEGDNFLHQAGAAFALARVARYTADEGAAAKAAHAILVLLEETMTEKQPDGQLARYTSLPSMVFNRLGAASLLVLAVHELPSPPKDLLDQAEELCNFIRRQARADGSLCCSDRHPDGAVDPEETDAVLHYPGQALYALMRSQTLRPAPWKIDLVRKAVAYYHPWWRTNKSMAFVPWQTAAYTEAYLLTHEKAFADCVFEMNDWLCTLQYEQIDPRHQMWMGGFKTWMDGKSLQTPPQILSAHYAESLAHAARAAREAPDGARHERYVAAVKSGLQFVGTLQYTEGGTLHFKESYRSRLVGGYHLSHQDGQMRIEYSQMALSALVTYLEHVVR